MSDTEKKVHKETTLTKVALEICMKKFADENEEGCQFDKETGEKSMSPAYLAGLYGCTTVYIKFIMQYGVGTIEGANKLAEIFKLSTIDFLKLGEQ